MTVNPAASGGARKVPPLDPWKSAYALAIANALFFLVMSIYAVLSKTDSISFNVSLALVFLVGSLVSVAALMRAGGVVSALTFYVLGSGIFFGFGTYYSTVADDYVYHVFFPTSLQRELLSTVNVLNALSVSAVLLGAAPLCWNRKSRGGGVIHGIGGLIDRLRPLLPLSLVAGFVYVLVIFGTFPQPGSHIMRSLLNYGQGIVFFGILICGARWRGTHWVYKLACLAIALAYAWYGVLGFSKTRILLPEISFMIGLALDRRARGALLVTAAALVLAYVTVIAPVANRCRNDGNYRPDNTVSERVEIVSRTFETLGATTQRRTASQPLLQRFASTPMQAFLIQQHNKGATGDSMQDAWISLVPRVLWADKPNVTRFGSDFDALMFRRAGESALAPTYSAELYWNFGWLGVVLGSLIVGLEIGWLTREWNRFLSEGVKHAGVFVFAVPIALLAGWVETWYVAPYLSGFVTLVILIALLNYLVPRLVVAVRLKANGAPEKSYA